MRTPRAIGGDPMRGILSVENRTERRLDIDTVVHALIEAPASR